MRQRFLMISCVALLLVPGSAQADEQEAPAKRLLALEAELQRLLGEVRSLRASLPNDKANVSAEIDAAYEAQMGEPMPPEILERATEEVIALRSRLVTQVVNRYVAEGKTQPIHATLAKPLVVLQARNGAGGGNAHRVDMTGALHRIRARLRVEIPWSPRVSIREESRAFVVGGLIPANKAFEITRVSWRGVAPGDSNGHGEFVVRVGGKMLVARKDDPAVTEGSWEGSLLVRPGQESQVEVVVANSSHIEARFEGRFIDLADAADSGK